MSIDDVADISPISGPYTALAAQTEFPYVFPIFSEDDLRVYVDDVLKALDTDYTVTGEGDDNGGTVTFLVAMAGGEVVVIYRQTAIERLTDFQTNGPRSSSDMNDELDKLTIIAQELRRDNGRSIRLPLEADVASDDIELRPLANWINKYIFIGATGAPEPAIAVDVDTLSQSAIGELLYPQTAAELAAAVTPSNHAYPPGDVRRYGAVGNGVADDTSAIQQAIDSTQTVYFPPGTYQCAGLTQATNGQRLYGAGNLTVLRKRANGVILTVEGDLVELEGIKFTGESATPAFTGDNLVLNGDHPRLINCASRWAYARAVYAPVAHVQIIGTCDIYQTTAAGANDYDIVIGVSGTATLYHAINGIYSSQATGGIHLIDTGGASVVASQFGKLFVDSGTNPAGVNGGMYVANRINGAVVVEVSNAIFSANQFNSTITLGTGTSGISIDETNAHAGGVPQVTNNGNADNHWAYFTTTAYRPNNGVTVSNAKAISLEGTVPGTDAVISMSASDNLGITNESSADGIVITQTGAGTISLDVNGARSAQFDASATATHTRFLIYDVDNATLERVTVGAPDSGGSGFKVLRIPN